eukprot:scaffold8337_cov67-Skeletonema_dohrnii-CCMP3373.AAC.1
MMLLYFGPNWSSSNKDSLWLMLHNGELHFQFSENTGKFQLAEKKMIADDQWHHIAVTMPFNSCRYSEVQLYIDGVRCETQQTHGSDNHMFFQTFGHLNIGGYGYRKNFDNDDGLLHMFEGEVDDAMVWSKPLQKQDILELWEDEPRPQDGSKAIVCGRGDGCGEGDRDVALVNEIHEVRCCRDCNNCSSPWKQKCPNYNLAVFARSKIQGVCKRGTFPEALDI